MMNSNYEKLEEIVKDENKLVTIVSLARDLKIFPDESIKILNNYVEINKDVLVNNTTYILSGRLKNENKLSICLVKLKDLEERKKLYEDDVKQILFSTQKSEFINSNWIALVNSEIQLSDNLLPNVVVGKNCVKRVLAKKTLPPLPPPCLKGRSVIFTKKLDPVKSEKEIETKKESSSSAPEINTPVAQTTNKTKNKTLDNKKKQTGSSGTLASFFSKVPIKQQTKPESSVTTQNSTTDSNNYKTKCQTENNKEEKAKNLSPDVLDSNSDEDILKDLAMHEEKPKAKPVAAKSTNSATKNKVKKSQKSTSSKSTKNRKRIIVDSDSEDDIFGSDKSDKEDVIENSIVEVEPEKVVKPLPPKNRKRKSVVKTYQDDDGFIVTKTEYIYESPSEDEAEPAVKVPKLDMHPTSSSNGISKEKVQTKKSGKSKKTTNGSSSGVQKITNFFQKK